MSNKLDEVTLDEVTKEVSVDLQKRAFIKKFGKYAVVGAGMSTLMTPAFSYADNYSQKETGGSACILLGNC